jgi:hypothetical protein
MLLENKTLLPFRIAGNERGSGKIRSLTRARGTA